MVHKHQCKSGKECEDLIGKAFPSPWDNNARHQNREGQISLNHKLLDFINVVGVSRRKGVIDSHPNVV